MDLEFGLTMWINRKAGAKLFSVSFISLCGKSGREAELIVN